MTISNEQRKLAHHHYEAGNRARKRGAFHEAISHYMEALAIDPESPARTAKEMLDEILAFHHKDALNP